MLGSSLTWLSLPPPCLWKVKTWTRSEFLNSSCTLESSGGPLKIPKPGSTPESWVYLVWGLTLVLFFPPFNSLSHGDSNVHKGLRTAGLNDQKVPFRSMISVLKLASGARANFPLAAKTIN